jgi:hypothetical protein
MLTGAQQHAADRFAKSLLALSDDALIDTYHQAAEDHGSARSESSSSKPFSLRKSSLPGLTRQSRSRLCLRRHCADARIKSGHDELKMPLNLSVRV